MGIKDIEDKLARRKQRKEGAEDGECIDSEEETAESVAEKARVENKKRWGKEGKPTETQSSSPPAALASSGAGCSKDSGQDEKKGKKDEEKTEKETAESVAEKARVENKKRWGKEGKPTETQSSSPPAALASSGAGCSK